MKRFQSWRRACSGLTFVGPCNDSPEICQVLRHFLNDLDLAFGWQPQHGEMLAYDVVPIRHSSALSQSC